MYTERGMSKFVYFCMFFFVISIRWNIIFRIDLGAYYLSNIFAFNNFYNN